MGVIGGFPYLDNLELVKLPGGTLLQLRKDTSTGGRTIYGYSAGGSSVSSAVWYIFAEDQIGSDFRRHFAHTPTFPGTETADFIHRWDLRSSLLDSPAFLNEFSLQLTGQSNSNASVPDSVDIEFANNIAFSLLIDFKSSVGGSADLFQKTSNSGGNNGYTATLDSSGRIEFEFRGTGTGDRIRVRTDSLGGIDLEDGSFHQLLITKSTSLLASGVNVYVDSVDQTLNTLNDTLSGVTTNSSSLFLGSNISGAARFTGNVDEFAVFGAQLTQADATEIFNSNNGAIDLQVATANIANNLNAYWRMGDGTFSAVPTIPDEEGTNTMTLGSAVKSGDIESVVRP